MPASVAAMGATFNLLNASINGYATSHFPPQSWLWIGLGATIFVSSWWMNLQSDLTLFRLRATGEYKIPHGGLFELIAAPNYFTETVEWCGFALASQSAAGIAFAFYTFANLAPRAVANWRWYKEKFADYPPERKAFLPFIW